MRDAPSRQTAGSFVKPMVEELADAGIELVAVVPDHHFDQLIPALSADSRFRVVLVAREDEGVAICCGAYYGGVSSALLMANAGFMLTPYAIASLAMFHRIPLVLLISHRGTLGDRAQHQEYQGLLTEPILRAMGIQSYTIDAIDQLAVIGKGLQHAELYKRPVALLLHGKLFKPIVPVYLDTGAAGSM